MFITVHEQAQGSHRKVIIDASMVVQIREKGKGCLIKMSSGQPVRAAESVDDVADLLARAGVNSVSNDRAVNASRPKPCPVVITVVDRDEKKVEVNVLDVASFSPDTGGKGTLVMLTDGTVIHLVEQFQHVANSLFTAAIHEAFVVGRR